MNFKEADMYAPIKAFFEGLGYVVRSEVKGIDVALVKDDSLTAVEMKKSFNASLLFQALEGQKVACGVFVALPRDAFLKKQGHILHILEKLGIGLVVVAMDSPVRWVEMQLIPNMAKSRNSRAARALLAEFNGRSFDENIGGTSAVRLLTAHKERSLQVACALERLGAVSPANLIRHFECHETTQQLLHKNVLGWFERVERGKYALSWQGHEALDEPLFARVVAMYREKFENLEGGCDVQAQKS